MLFRSKVLAHGAAVIEAVVIVVFLISDIDHTDVAVHVHQVDDSVSQSLVVLEDGIGVIIGGRQRFLYILGILKERGGLPGIFR